MRFTAALQGNLRDVLRAEVRAMAPPLRRALKAGGARLKGDLKAQAEAADLGRLGKAWAHRHYRGRYNPFDMVSIVFPRGRAVRKAIAAFDQGVTVRPVNAKYLAIPTQWNRKSGRRGGRVLYKPGEIRDRFVARARNGNLILFARVSKVEMKTKQGRIRQKAFVNSTLKGKNQAKLLGSGRVRRTEAILEYGVVPMFVLVPEVKLKKRLDLDAVIGPVLDALPAMIVKEMDHEDAEQARSRDAGARGSA